MNTDTPAKRGIFGRIIRWPWQLLKVLNTLVFGMLSVLLIAAVVFFFIEQRAARIPSGGALLIKPEGTLVEQKTALEATALLQGGDMPRQALVSDITDALKRARDDDRIGLVVLDLDKLDHGHLPMIEMVAAAISDYRKSGRKVIAIADNYSQSALLLAAHADEVLLNPEGMAVPQGFSMYRTYFNSLLESHEVSVNLFKVGEYKSAVDPFFRDSMSTEDRTARSAILNTWWESYTSAMESARDMPAGSIDAMLQDAPAELAKAEGDLARLSLEKGFVDRLLSDSERQRYLIDLAGEDKENHDYRKVDYREYLRVAHSAEESPADRIAVVTAVGNIFDGMAPAGQIGSRSLIGLIRQARRDSQVKAIVLRIDSGGGSKSASEMIRRELQAAQEEGLPVVASMGAVAASGGYWIAATADEIWASPTTITGSIGIFGLMPSVERTLARHGIHSDGVSTTPVAGGASVLRGLSPEYAEILQTTVEAGYEQFLSTVASGRGMQEDEVHDVAQGRVWTGEAASELGLVDSLGDLDQAIEAAANLAGIDDYTVWNVVPEMSLEDRVIRQFTETLVSALPAINGDPLSRLVALLYRQGSVAWQMNDPRHVYVICADCPTSSLTE